VIVKISDIIKEGVAAGCCLKGLGLFGTSKNPILKKEQ
jgi:hypothetical protein